MKKRVILFFVWVTLGSAEFSGSLVDYFKSIDEEELASNRVTFSRGGIGVQKDDMILSEEQNAWLFGDDDDVSDEPQNRTKRAGIKLKKHIRFWKNGVVPYIINPKDFNQEEQLQLRQAMDIYEDLTCLKFIERTNQPQWVFIHHTNKGCSSYVGDARKYNPGPQPLSLKQPGCRNFGTYLHELGHAIGLVHEHQLPNRDKHIRYYGTNVDPNKISQLEKYHPRVVNTFNTPYDLGSIMHYGVTSFSIDDMSPTLGVDNPWLAQHIGRRYSDMLSFGDVRTITYLYQCNARCDPNLKRSCPEPGFINEKCDCETPQSYFQRYCKDEEGYEGWCQNLVPQGKCDIKNLELHKTCKKSCGFCPMFKPGDTAIGPQQQALAKQCVDRYHNPMMCKKWSAYCSKSPWMHRYCRATCGACKSKIGDCSNSRVDSTCDKYAKRGYCTRIDKEYIRVTCADSCGTCGLRNQDKDCRNQASDQQCAVWASQNLCEQNPVKMFDQCPSTCNRCYWNKGSCANQANEKECVMMALQNYCVGGGKKHHEMRRLCPKTCDSCGGA